MNLALELSEIEKQVSDLISENIEYKKQLTKAKEIIKTFCGFCGVFNSTNGSLDNIIARAEQFLKDQEEANGNYKG